MSEAEISVEGPVMRLRPKKSGQRFRFGAQLVFADEVVMDRRTRALEPGTIATLIDDARRPVARVAVAKGDKLAARILDLDPEANIDRAWFDTRVARALAHRNAAYDAPYYRLIHAEADGLPGVIVDRFGPHLVIQPNAAWVEPCLDVLGASLLAATGAETLYANGGSRARTLEGLDPADRDLVGVTPDRVDVPMNGATYCADLRGGQKTGLFFDQRDNHAFAARLSRGRQVLDMFCHVGGFGLAALAAGAEGCRFVDASQAALDLAEAGAKATGLADRATFQRGDAVETLRALGDAGECFGLVVCDPPAFAPHRGALDAGLRAYERVANGAARLVDPGGYLVLCSCSQAAGLDAFRDACVTGIGKARRRGVIVGTGFAGPDHPVHPGLSDYGYLKALFFRIE